MNTLVKILLSSSSALDIQALWEEYELGLSPEAKVCKDLDKFEMILQAFEYEKSESSWIELKFGFTFFYFQFIPFPIL